MRPSSLRASLIVQRETSRSFMVGAVSERSMTSMLPVGPMDYPIHTSILPCAILALPMKKWKTRHATIKAWGCFPTGTKSGQSSLLRQLKVLRQKIVKSYSPTIKRNSKRLEDRPGYGPGLTKRLPGFSWLVILFLHLPSLFRAQRVG